MPLDLRTQPHAERPCVVIDNRVHPSRVLLTDFSSWGEVINLSYSGTDSDDFDWFESYCKTRGYSDLEAFHDPRIRPMIIKSWDRVIRDLKGEYAPGPKETDTSIQASLWEIHAADIVRVRVRE